MSSTNPISNFLSHVPPLLPLILFLLVRGLTSAIGTNPSRPAPPQRMTNARVIARSVSGWRTSNAGRRGGTPRPTPSPRSDPMWDRELDG